MLNVQPDAVPDELKQYARADRILSLESAGLPGAVVVGLRFGLSLVVAAHALPKRNRKNQPSTRLSD
jgi:adenine/guanine phosphoribosyltransferase-like PRPP-binding protein